MADPRAVLPAHEKYGLPLGFTSDSQTVYTGGFDGRVSAWSVSEELERASRSIHEQSVNCGGIAGEMLITGSTDCTIRRTPLSLDAHGDVLDGHSNTVTDVAVHPDAQKLASGSYDSTVRIWDLDDGADPVILEGHERNVTCVEFLDGGSGVVSGGLGADLFVWDTDTRDVVTTLGGHGDAVVGVAVEDASRIWTVSYDGQLCCWETGDWSAVTTVDLELDGKATGLAARPTGDELAVTRDGGLHIVDTNGDTVATHETSIKGISSPCWSPDGRILGVGGADGAVRLYE